MKNNDLQQNDSFLPARSARKTLKVLACPTVFIGRTEGSSLTELPVVKGSLSIGDGWSEEPEKKEKPASFTWEGTLGRIDQKMGRLLFPDMSRRERRRKISEYNRKKKHKRK